MRHIKNFLHNINDIVLAVVIVALAAGIIYWRLQIILDYPEQLAEQQAVYNEEQTDDAEAQAEGEAADADAQQAAPEEKAEEAPSENADAADEAAQQAAPEEAPAEGAPADNAAEQPEG